MESLFFLEDQIQNGLTFRMGQSMVDGAFLRWEPVAVKLKGNEAVFFRESITARKEIFSGPGVVPGILQVTGPVAWEGKIWLGFEARGGKSVFEMDRNRVTLGQLINGLTPLIHAYASCHQSREKVGQPDWSRFLFDAAGFFMLDPFVRPYLFSPPSTLPSGLAACYPPEIYRGERYEAPCDLFFLGLILYYVITGALPYRLVKGWPNQNLLAGIVIPPAFHCPDLNPKLGELMVNLLAVDPARRPPAQEVTEGWDEILKREEYTISKLEAVTQVRGNQRLWRKQQGMRIIKLAQVPLQGRKWAFITVLAVSFGLIYGWSLLTTAAGEVSPQEVARNFYAKAAVIPGPVLGLMNEEEPAGLLKDFDQARQERLKIVDDVLSRPLARVDSLRVMEAGPKSARIEVGLTWWSWDGAGWRRSERREFLVMEKVKKEWRVKERRGVKSSIPK